MTDLAGTSFQAPLDTSQRTIEIGNVFNLTYRTFRQRPWTFIGLAILPIVFTVLVVVCQGLVAFNQDFAKSAGAVGGIATIAQYIILIVTYGAVIHAATRLLVGASFTIGEALRAGLRRFFPVLGLGILMLLMIGLGTLLLIVPGVIVSFMLAVAIQACVVEDRGPIESIKRSFALTKGNKWRIFLSYLLTILLPMIVLYIAIAILAAVVIGGGSALFGQSSAVTIVAGVIVVLIAVPGFLVISAAAQIILAVLLFELRRVKEGYGQEGVAQVFD